MKQYFFPPAPSGAVRGLRASNQSYHFVEDMVKMYRTYSCVTPWSSAGVLQIHISRNQTNLGNINNKTFSLGSKIVASFG